jgi:SdpI/YfhL protein family
MDVIPVPEIVAGLLIVLVLASVRALWKALASRAGNFRPPRQEGPDTQRARLFASCVIVAIISVPLILGVVPPNGIYGFRTAVTRSSRAVWYPANAFAGWALLSAASVSATLLAILPGTVRRWLLWAILWVPIFGAFVASLAYVSYLN